MSEQIVDAGTDLILNAIGGATYNAVTSAQSQSNLELDLAFERLHTGLAANTKVTQHTYNPANYKRVAFKTADEAKAFAAYVSQLSASQKNENEVVVMPVKVNGQYLVEIPKTIEREKQPETFENLHTQQPKPQFEYGQPNTSAQSNTSSESEESYYPKQNYYPEEEEKEEEEENKQGVPPVYQSEERYETVSADDIIEEYKEQTGVEIEVPNSNQRYDATRSNVPLMNLVTNEMDFFGTVVNKAARSVGWVEVNSGVNPNAVFESKHLSALRFSASGKTSPTASKPSVFPTALVVNDSLVLIDGHVCTDSAIVDKVLKQHSYRKDKANKIIVDYNKKEKSRKIQFEAEEKAREKAFDKKEDEREKKFNNNQDELEKRFNAINKQRIAEGKPPIPFQREKYERKTYTRREDKVSISESISHKLEERRSKNAEAIVATLYEQEYSAEIYKPEYVSIRKKTAFEEWANKFNEGILIVKSMEKKATFSSTEIGKLHNAVKNSGEKLNGDHKKVIQKVIAATETSGVSLGVSLFAEKEITFSAEERRLFTEATTILGCAEIAENHGIPLTENELDMVNDIEAKLKGIAQFQSGLQMAQEFSFDKEQIDVVKAMFYRQKELKSGSEYVAVLTDVITDTAKSGGNVRLSTPQRERMTKTIQDYHAILQDEIKKIDAKMADPTFIGTASATEMNNLKSQRDSLNKQIQTIGEIEQKIKVTERATNYELKFDFKSALDNAIAVPITTEDILKFNEDFIKRAELMGYQFVKTSGKFDTKAFENLPPKALEKLGLTEETYKLLGELNGCKIDNPVTKLAQSAGSAMTQLLAQSSSDWSETLEDFNRMKKTAEAGKKGYQVGKKVVGIMKHNYDKSNLQKVGAGSGSTADVKTGIAEVKKQTKKSRVNEEANRKYLAMLRKKHTFLNKFENSVVGKTLKSYNMVKAKAANKIKESFVGKAATAVKGVVAGAAAHVLPVAGAVLLVIVFMLIIILLLLVFIQSFASIGDVIDDLYAAKSAEDTVAFQLYGTLKQQEREWVEKDLGNFDNLYKNRTTTKFGDRYYSYETYVDTFPNLRIEGEGNSGKLYITPFASSTYKASEDAVKNPVVTGLDGYMYNTNKFNGTQTISIVTNSNVLGKVSDTDDSDGSGYDEHGSLTDYISSNNGHTSNIKDIISMADVLYGLDLESNDDSLLGKAPEQIAWEGSWLYGGMKWIQGCFGGREETNIEREQGEEGIKNYKALQSYAFNLFEVSHQQTLKLKTEFHDKANSDEWNDCDNKTTTKFPIYWDGTTITPYLEDSGEAKIPLYKGIESYEFTENVSMANCTEDSGSWCLDDGQGNNWGTWSKLTGNACWEKDPTISYYLDSSSGIDSSTVCSLGHIAVFDIGYDENKDTGGMWKYRYPLQWSSMANGMMNNGYNYSKDADAGNYIIDNMRKFIEEHKLPEKTEYILSDDRNTFTVKRYLPNEQYLPPDDNSCNITEFFNNAVNSQGEKFLVDQTSHWTGEDGWTQHYNLKFYRYTIEETTYHRNCKGHNFEYCGGHIAAHSQGIVYSATNEQLAMAGTMDSYRNPVATDDEWLAATTKTMEDWGYDDIRGKIDAGKLDKSSNERANDSGKALKPTQDVQGSYITNYYGLNLHVEKDDFFETGGTDPNLWTKDSRNHDFENFFLKDIFDIDMRLDKGNNVFPPYVTEIAESDYEGWTSDAMTLALCRIATDWNDLYGFEIPFEIGEKDSYPLSNENIQDIIDGVKTAYPDLSKEKEERIHLALSWVGMGNYADNHNHDFLSVCGSHEIRTNLVPSGICFDVNCTASDDLGFVNFILKRTGENRLDNREVGSWSSTSYKHLSPGDIVRYQCKDDDGNLITDKDGNPIYHYGVYIGYLKNDAEPVKLQYADVNIADKKTAEKTLDETINPDTPIIVDMDTNGEYGTIYLRGTDKSILKNGSETVENFMKLN